MNMQLRLGTRRSILAMAQSRQIASELERRHPGLEVQLVGLETRGDRTLDVPLSQMEGKDFFVAELDEALLTRQVDLTVHSMKDLSIERPGNILTAAIPRRANPRDAVLFAPDILDRLKRGKPIRLGTSSPRRLENVPPFLRRALPAPAISRISLAGKFAAMSLPASATSGCLKTTRARSTPWCLPSPGCCGCARTPPERRHSPPCCPDCAG